MAHCWMEANVPKSRGLDFDLQTMFLLQLQVFFPQCVHAVNHLLDKLDLRVAKAVLVRRVVSAAIIAARLSPSSTGLDSEFLAPLLKSIDALLDVAGQVDHDGSPHAGAQVGGAGVDVAVLLGQGELLARLSLDGVPDSLDAAREAGEDSLDVAALFHGDDPHLVPH